MANEIAIDGVQCWLPPGYKDFVIGHSMQGESFTFRGLRTRYENRESRTKYVEQYHTHTHIVDGYKILPIPIAMGIKLYPYPYPAGTHTH
jgi:hypothetical protein